MKDLPELTPTQRTGRTILLLIFAALLVPNVLIIAKRVSMPGVVRLLLTLGLMYAVWVGEGWAKKLLGYLCGLGAAIAAFSGSEVGPLVGVIYLFCAATLLTLPSVRAFLEYQNQAFETGKK